MGIFSVGGERGIEGVVPRCVFDRVDTGRLASWCLVTRRIWVAGQSKKGFGEAQDRVQTPDGQLMRREGGVPKVWNLCAGVTSKTVDSSEGPEAIHQFLQRPVSDPG